MDRLFGLETFGYRAYDITLDIDEMCPFSQGTPEREAFKKGWDQAEKEYMEAPNDI